MSFLQRPDCQIYYKLHGDSHAPIITMLNGATRPCSDLRNLAKTLNSVGWQCLLIDHRGAGQSLVQTAFSLKNSADDVLALWENLGISKPNLLGISMGGVLAQMLSAEIQLDSLILISTCAKEEHLLSSTSKMLANPQHENVSKFLAPYFSQKFQTQSQPLIKAMVKQMYTKLSDENFRQNLIWQNSALQAAFKDLKTPIPPSSSLVIHGEKDQIIPIQAAHLLKEIFKGKLETLDTGHLILAEQSKTLSKIVTEFMSR